MDGSVLDAVKYFAVIVFNCWESAALMPKEWPPKLVA
jgi:hypothetical protein